ncbi:hypothetical protein CK203_027950 [Vitis vinifera]|uniref:Retrotransposon gag domain-containing protein n=1 Tax=Vitis vinifera TaxID=29760 RepID=A0A438J3D8_VITVI|nr:hypothetical protein CK203_027950 [Vitis vinifera]
MNSLLIINEPRNRCSEFQKLGNQKESYWGMTGQESNTATLFQLYVDHGRYTEATTLLLEYIESFASMAITHSGQISLVISQSDHLSLSFQSSVPVLRAKGENAFRSVESSSENTHRRQNFPANFSGELSGDGFFLHRKERLEEIFNLSQSTGTRNPSTRRPRAFSVRRLHLTRRRVRAREPLSGDALPPPGSPDADPATLPTCLCNPSPASASFGFFCFRGPSDQIFRRPPAIFSQLQSLHVPWEVFFYLSGHKLNGHNYLQWSQSVLLFICGKGKDEYLTGEAVMPETTEPGFRKWKIENSMIMSWLINSMNNDIGENFLLFGTAKDIWDAAKETYSSSENTSELFQVESALHDFRQGEQSVTQYYNHTHKAESWALNPCQVSGRLFQRLGREESRKKVMMGSKEQPAPTLDASALAAPVI